jgi:hypothetical protein
MFSSKSLSYALLLHACLIHCGKVDVYAWQRDREMYVVTMTALRYQNLLQWQRFDIMTLQWQCFAIAMLSRRCNVSASLLRRCNGSDMLPRRCNVSAAKRYQDVAVAALNYEDVAVAVAAQ